MMLRKRILVVAAICLAVGLGSAQAAMLLVDANVSNGSPWLNAPTGGANYDNNLFEANPSLGLTITGKGNVYNTTFWGSPPTFDLWSKIDSVDGTLVPAGAYRMLADYKAYQPGDPASASSITITNLKAGTYDLTVFGVKGEANTNTYTYYVNGALFGTTQNVPYNNPSSLTAAQIVSKITKTASITILDTGTYANKLVIRSNDWDQPLNGIALTPEPATLVLLALGGLAAVRRRHA
jgi:hypothetical protein